MLADPLTVLRLVCVQLKSEQHINNSKSDRAKLCCWCKDMQVIEKALSMKTWATKDPPTGVVGIGAIKVGFFNQSWIQPVKDVAPDMIHSHILSQSRSEDMLLSFQRVQ